jgi:putative ubiquitin-RnfH superfamily antitoxin RatB of RatAB toxin-antitoxin module
MARDDSLRIEVVYAAAPHDVRSAEVTLASGATVADALRASRLLEGLSAAAADALQAGIWGRAAALGTRLRDGDRVELTRGLLVDPKEARRQRYKRDGVRRNKPGLKSRCTPTR